MAPPLHAPERFEAVLEARAATASRAIDAIVDLVPPHDYGPAAVGRALRYGAVQRGDVGAIVAEASEGATERALPRGGSPGGEGQVA